MSLTAQIDRILKMFFLSTKGDRFESAYAIGAVLALRLNEKMGSDQRQNVEEWVKEPPRIEVPGELPKVLECVPLRNHGIVQANGRLLIALVHFPVISNYLVTYDHI